MVSACQPSPTDELQPATVITPTASQQAGVVGFSHEGLEVTLPKPEGWESFTTEYGVVIAEQFGTVADQGMLQGLMAYVFVTPNDEFPLPVSGGEPVNRAQLALRQIVGDASFIGSARVTDPVGFRWGETEAAYYLLSDTQSALKTLVVGIALPDKDALVIGTLSAPDDKAETIRAALESLFGQLNINGSPLSVDDLSVFPDPLVFP